MNDPNKRIDVNISSLLSLKAELLRKQDEVNKAKSSHSIENFIPKKITKPVKSVPKKINENPKEIDRSFEVENSALLIKSRKVLEMKSKYYDRMSNMGGSLNSDENCLVMFNKKQQDTRDVLENDISSDDDKNEEKYVSNNPDEDWVEYTDCLGRSRKCLRKDLEFFKKKDNVLSDDIQPRTENTEQVNWVIDTEGETIVAESIEEPIEEAYEIGVKEQMKINWERQERENMDKEFIHYQDVLFDEARTHGVGFYKFSTDDQEREKQRYELDKLREATLLEQKKRDEQRTSREKILAERVRAAKNRQRARQGLPPLEDEPEPSAKSNEELYDTTEERDRKQAEEKLRVEKEIDDKRREQERQKHIRPWDKGKTKGDNKTKGKSYEISDDEEEEWRLKIEREPMSQEQWNNKKREERPLEFAPLYTTTLPTEQLKSRFFQRNKFTDNQLDKEVEEETTKSLYFTTKKKVPESIPIPIENELSESDDEELEYDREVEANQLNARRGAEIAPPPTFDYYGPSSSKKSKNNRVPMTQHLETSIEAGLKFLREQSDKNASSGGKRVWTTKQDY